MKSFARLQLAAGEKKTVQVELPWQAFQIVNAQGQSVVEPGEFEIRVGSQQGDLPDPKRAQKEHDNSLDGTVGSSPARTFIVDFQVGITRCTP